MLIKQLYHCKPSDLDWELASILDLHYSFLQAEATHQKIKQKELEQEEEMKKLLAQQTWS